MTNGRAKGSTAEREVAKLMEAWWQPLEPGCRFVRTPLSGGWHGPDVRQGFKASGDLMTTAHRFPFTVEVKRREKSFREYLAGRASPVWGWWLQAQAQATEQGGGVEPMLLFRTSRQPWRMLLRASYVESLGELGRMMHEEMMGHFFVGRWPQSRGVRPVGYELGATMFALPPRLFALPEAVTSVRRRHVKDSGDEPRSPR